MDFQKRFSRKNILRIVLRMRTSGAIPLLPLDTSMAWTGITLLLRCSGYFCVRKPLAKSTASYIPPIQYWVKAASYSWSRTIFEGTHCLWEMKLSRGNGLLDVTTNSPAASCLHFRETWCLHLQGCTWKVEAEFSFDKLLTNYKTTRCHNPICIFVAELLTSPS